MQENELMLWTTVAMVGGGALLAWVMNFQVWKGAAVVIAGLALSTAGAAMFGTTSDLANLALFAVGAAVTGGAIGFGLKETGSTIAGAVVCAFATTFIVQLVAT